MRLAGLISPPLLASAVLLGGQSGADAAYLAIMAGQTARPLNGSFNNVPVLHSNQPEEVEGPGILINTAAGSAVTAETRQILPNAEYVFQGAFGLHVHHKYFPPYRDSISPGQRRTQLNLAAILTNPGSSPVHIRFEAGAVRNSFEAPYLANNLMGVKPLGVRPWNTGPGDATAVQLLRGKLDTKLLDEITIPARSRVVLFNTPLPALGIANALLKGRSDGPFTMAVVAVRDPQSEADILNVLDAGQLAPGRVYLNRINDITNGRVFSRVGGVALGDTYTASISHDLDRLGPLHVPLTSTERHNFGTRDIQVNQLVSRMLDSSLNNVGTYGVRFDVDLNLLGNGPYELVLSHPAPNGGRDFTAFRGSIQVKTEDGIRDVHVGLRSGQSLSLATLMLKPGMNNPVRISLVYPADATPGHLLSVVSSSQLARVQEQERQIALARAAAPTNATPRTAPPPPGAASLAEIAPPPPILRPPAMVRRSRPYPPRLSSDEMIYLAPPPELPLINTLPDGPRPTSIGRLPGSNSSLEDSYQRAVEAQSDTLRWLQRP